MKKRLVVFVILLICVCSFAFSSDSTDSSETKKSKSITLVGITDRFSIPSYGTDLGLIVEKRFKINDFFSISTFANFNFNPIPKAFSNTVEYWEQTNNWLGEDTIIINFLLLGIPYVYPITMTLWESQFILDFGSYFYYHPFFNENWETSLGLGLSSEPYEAYKATGKAWFFLPMATVKAEVIYHINIFYASFWACYSLDILDTISSDSDDYHGGCSPLELGISTGLYL